MEFKPKSTLKSSTVLTEADRLKIRHNANEPLYELMGTSSKDVKNLLSQILSDLKDKGIEICSSRVIDAVWNSNATISERVACLHFVGIVESTILRD
jgi:hypothetical protein